MSLASLVCSFTFGWLIAAPAWIVVMVAIAYNLTAIGDSSVYSTAMTELVPGHCLGAAFALRSVLGFGVGAISPWVFGLVLDLGQGAGSARADAAWGWAWTVLGIGAVLGPIATLRLRALSETHRWRAGSAETLAFLGLGSSPGRVEHSPSGCDPVQMLTVFCGGWLIAQHTLNSLRSPPARGCVNEIDIN